MGPKLKGKGLTKIPSSYIVNRWTKLANRKPIFDITNNVLDTFSKSENESKLISDVWGHTTKKLFFYDAHSKKVI